MIGDIVLLVDRQQLLTLQILPWNAIDKKCVLTVFQVVKNGIRRDDAVLTLEVFCYRRRGECRSGILEDVGDNAFQQINIPDLVPLHDIFQYDRVV